MFEFPEPARSVHQHDVIKLACEPIETVRIAFIGLGKRGKESFNHYLHIPNVQVVAVCDVNPANLAFATNLLSEHGLPAACAYSQPDDWKAVCERTDVDLIYVCTHWLLHTPIAVYAMQQGKHVALEVPAALTVADCWALVDAAELTRRHCLMLENCCYGRFELAVLNMVQQNVLGEVFHCEGAYIHDLRGLDFEAKPDYLATWKMQGNPYPTHGLGPLCQILNIHRGDRLEMLVSMSSGQFCAPSAATFEKGEAVLGNMNTSIIRTNQGKTIVLQHDISSPRPYSRSYLVSGTKGFADRRAAPGIALEDASCTYLPDSEMEKFLQKYDHPFYGELGEQAARVGAHGGMDFIMDYRLIHCLRNGLPLDMDVYDAAEWSCMVELTRQSVLLGSVPVKIPDFTRGAWGKLDGLAFAR